MDQIRFKIGTFQNFISTRSFALGSFDTQIGSGEEIAFDGSTVQYAGNEYSFPNLRGAIKAGWLVLAEEYDEGNPDYGRPVSANIKVRHPTEGGNPLNPQKRMIATTESDEQIVGNIAEHAANTKAANAQRPQRATMATSADVEAQDGIPVRSLKTPAVSKTTMTSETAGSALRDAESVQIDAGKGVSEDEMLAKMSADERDEYLAKKGSAKAKYMPDNTEVRRVVATAVTSDKNESSEGIKRKASVGGGIETADPLDPGDKAEETSHTVEGMTFKNTNGPQDKTQPHPRSEAAKEVSGASEEARRTVAKAVCPDFPESYDFGASPRKKLARLTADFEDRPDVIRAVFAAESDNFKAALVDEFPTAFQG